MSEPGDAQPGFKRLNFFRGLVTYYTDWLDREAYRVGKLRWHSQRCHGPGVVPGTGGDLLVLARGDLAVEVLPGYAIDGQGREMMLTEPQLRSLDPATLPGIKLPETAYIVARYEEEPTDFVSYRHNTQIQGHRRVAEGCRIEVSINPPDVSREVELARVLLTPGVRAINPPRDPLVPVANEVDLRFVPWAGFAGGIVDRQLVLAIESMLQRMRDSLGQLSRVAKVATARNALAQAIAASTLHAAGLTNSRTLLAMFYTLFEMQVAVYLDLKQNHPKLAATVQFSEWTTELRALQGYLRKSGPVHERLIACCNTQHHLNDIILTMMVKNFKRA